MKAMIDVLRCHSFFILQKCFQNTGKNILEVFSSFCHSKVTQTRLWRMCGSRPSLRMNQSLLRVKKMLKFWMKIFNLMYWMLTGFWQEGQPNGGPDQNCIRTYLDRRWQDINCLDMCDFHYFRYIILFLRDSLFLLHHLIFILNRYCAVCEFPKRMNLTMRGLCSTGKLKTPRTVPAYHITP